MSITETITSNGGSLAYALAGLVIFAESGILLGFFLPGDTLLVALGIAARAGSLSFWWAVLAVAIAAIIGDSVGYGIGKYAGEALIKRSIIPGHYKERAHKLYERHGMLAVLLARYIPIVRTIVPTAAGVAHMNYSRFLSANVIGGILWAISMTGVGYLLAGVVPNLESRVEHIMIGVVALSVLLAARESLPIVLDYYKKKRKNGNNA